MMPELNTETPFWSIDTDRLLEQLETTALGLTQTAAAERAGKSNRLQQKQVSVWSLLLHQFNSPIILLLFCSAVLSFTLIDDPTNAWIIIFILIASGLLGFWQELNAADAVAKLRSMIETKATVRRDGHEQQLPIESIVRGDIVSIQAGDLIPGDCRLLDSRDLCLNEAVLTGESFPSEKSPSVLPMQTPLGQRTNALYLGTHVVSGYGTAVVAAVGRDTELGRISGRLRQKPPETGFARGLRSFGQLLVKVVLLITIIVFAIKVGVQGKGLVDSLLVGLALAVGMTPQLLPAVTSVVLAVGAKAMARQQVIVKQLMSIENLGSMTVLCADKTGTLTEGVIGLTGALDIHGQFSERVLKYAYFNALFQTGFANPIDRAICEREKFDLAGVEKLDEIPYDFVRKRLSVRIAESGRKLLITKGALNSTLDCCTRVETVAGDVVDIASQRSEIGRLFADKSAQGLRVLGLAVREEYAERISHAHERDMTFLGFLVFSDPPKADAKETLQQLRDLGVELKIITGDNRAVAASIGEQVGIESPTILTGAELRLLSDEALKRRTCATHIFAEVEPNQKERVILALKKSGHVVGYLGDGINDASALHAADVGLSVASAVDVAREAAQVVLLKQDLGVLVQGVREGRRTFANTLKYVFFAIAANFGYMFSLAVASLFLPFEPLLASQILLVNLLADFPAMALATDNVDPEQIQRPRRWDAKSIARFMLLFGFSSSMFDFMTFGAMYAIFGLQEELFRTGWFVESTLTGLVIMMIVRTQRPLYRSYPSRLFMITVAAIAAITLVLPFSPFAKALGFVTPPPMLLLVAIVITVLYAVGLEIVKHLSRRYVAM